LLLFVICYSTYCSYRPYAGIKIPKDKIPTNIPAKVRVQIERTYSHKPEKRANAAYALGRIGNEAAAAVPFLLFMLDDNYPYYPSDYDDFISNKGYGYMLIQYDSPSRAAVRALGDINDERAVKPLIKIINSRYAWFFYGLSEYVSRLSESLAVNMKRIKEAYIDGSGFKVYSRYSPSSLGKKEWLHRIQVDAATALGKIGDKRAVKPLIGIINDGGDYSKIFIVLRTESSIRALAKIGDKRAVKPLIRQLNDSKVKIYIREEAATALGELGDTSAIEPLLEFINSDKKTIYTKAASADGAAAAALVKLDPAWRNSEACEAIISELITIITSDKFSHSNVEVIYSLVIIDSNMARDIIISELKTLPHQNSKIKPLLKALGNTGEAGIDELIRLLKNADSDWIRNSVIDVLRYKSGSKVTESLIYVLEDKYGSIRFNVVDALAARKDPRAVEALMNLLETTDDDKSSLYIIKKLAQNGYKGMDELLINMMNDIDGVTRIKRSIARDLGNLSTKKSVDALIKALDDEDIRDAVIRALGNSEDPRAVEPLINILKMNEDKKTIISNVYALDGITGMKNYGDSLPWHLVYDKSKWLSWWEENRDEYSDKSNAD